MLMAVAAVNTTGWNAASVPTPGALTTLVVKPETAFGGPDNENALLGFPGMLTEYQFAATRVATLLGQFTEFPTIAVVPPAVKMRGVPDGIAPTAATNKEEEELVQL